MPQRRLATNTVFSPSGRWPPLTPLLLPSTAGETTHQKRKLLLGKDDPHVQGRPLIPLSSPFPTQPLLPSLLTPNLMGFTASPPAALATLLLSDKAPVPFTWHTRTAPPKPPAFLFSSRQTWWLRWESICLQCGRPRFNPWVRKISWRRKWKPTPVFLPGKSHGWRSLVGYNPWSCKVSDTTERLHFSLSRQIC